MSVKKAIDRNFESVRWVWWYEMAKAADADIRHVLVDLKSGQPAPISPALEHIKPDLPRRVIATMQQIGSNLAVWMAPDPES